MINKLSLLILSASIFCSCNSPESSSDSAAVKGDSTATTTKSDASDWVSLFDGKSTAGWHSYGKTTVDSIWKVADGAIYLDTTIKTPHSSISQDLVSQDEYDNFHLKLEWKIAPKGNSGLIFYKTAIIIQVHPGFVQQ